ncbi:hypothetical protein LP420_14635 [Massilia sp. B-10]|nr:hypothetical protein LP420_14635 [Massilia sp. B-10]
MLQMILERREEDVVSGSTAALTRDRTTNSGALSYSAQARRPPGHGQRPPGRQLAVRLQEHRRHRLRLPSHARTARQRQLRNQLPRADLQ